MDARTAHISREYQYLFTEYAYLWELKTEDCLPPTKVSVV
jgi:tRNA U38,U39,U40 pseudouridine synthase TruA